MFFPHDPRAVLVTGESVAKLKAVLDTLDGVPDELRGLYVEDDGKFRLDAEGVEDVTGLKNALSREKIEAKKLKMKYADIDPEKYAELLAREDEFTQGHLTDKQKEQLESMKTQLQAAHAKEMGKMADRAKLLETALRRELISGRATTAINAAKGSVKLLLPVIERQSDMLEEDGKFVPVVLDEHGQPRLNSEGEPMSYGELIAAFREDTEVAGAFEGIGSSGGGAPRSAAGGGGKTVIAASDNVAFVNNLEAIASGKIQVR